MVGILDFIYEKIMYIICTPINLVSPTTSDGKKARMDYLREQAHFEEYNKARWDDSRYNTAKIGDYFAFVHCTQNFVEIFVITDITDAKNRPDHWDMPNHRNRNVLILSKKITETTWTDFKQKLYTNKGPYEKDFVQGTTRHEFR